MSQSPGQFGSDDTTPHTSPTEPGAPPTAAPTSAAWPGLEGPQVPAGQPDAAPAQPPSTGSWPTTSTGSWPTASTGSWPGVTTAPYAPIPGAAADTGAFAPSPSPVTQFGAPTSPPAPHFGEPAGAAWPAMGVAAPPLPTRPRKSMVIFGSILTVLILAIGFLVFRLVMPKDVEDLPRAAADYVEVIDTISTPKISVPNEIAPSDGGVIRTPDTRLQIDSVGEVESLEIRRGQPNQPAEGYKFMVITLSYDASTGRDGTDTTFALDINGTRVPLEDVVSLYRFGTQIVASVPDDDSARLVVTYADYDQFFSVATGERTPDPVTDQFYRPDRYVEHPELATAPTQVYAGGTQSYITFEPQSATASLAR